MEVNWYSITTFEINIIFWKIYVTNNMNYRNWCSFAHTNLSNGKIFVLLLKIEIGDWKLKKINRKDVAAQLLITNTFLIIKQRIKFYFYWIFILNIWNIL